VYSISEVSKLTGLSSRALRHYEDKGLISSSRGRKNGYRYYSKEELAKIEEIKKFKKMEFSLEEIKSFLCCDENLLQSSLLTKLTSKSKSLDEEISRLQKSKAEIQNLLLATKNFFNGKVLEKGQRRIFMEAIKKEVQTRS